MITPFTPYVCSGGPLPVLAYLDVEEGEGFILVPAGTSMHNYRLALKRLHARGWHELLPDETGEPVEVLPNGAVKIWLDNERIAEANMYATHGHGWLWPPLERSGRYYRSMSA